MEFTSSLPTLFFLLNFYETLVCDRVWVSFSWRLILYQHTCLESSWWSWWLWVFDGYTGQEWVKPIKTQWVQWLVGENHSRAHKGKSCQLLEPTGYAKKLSQFRGHPHSTTHQGLLDPDHNLTPSLPPSPPPKTRVHIHRDHRHPSPALHHGRLTCQPISLQKALSS